LSPLVEKQIPPFDFAQGRRRSAPRNDKGSARQCKRGRPRPCESTTSAFEACHSERSQARSAEGARNLLFCCRFVEKQIRPFDFASGQAPLLGMTKGFVEGRGLQPCQLSSCQGKRAGTAQWQSIPRRMGAFLHSQTAAARVNSCPSTLASNRIFPPPAGSLAPRSRCLC